MNAYVHAAIDSLQNMGVLPEVNDRTGRMDASNKKLQNPQLNYHPIYRTFYRQPMIGFLPGPFYPYRIPFPTPIRPAYQSLALDDGLSEHEALARLQILKELLEQEEGGPKVKLFTSIDSTASSYPEGRQAGLSSVISAAVSAAAAAASSAASAASAAAAALAAAALLSDDLDRPAAACHCHPAAAQPALPHRPLLPRCGAAFLLPAAADARGMAL